MRKIFFTISEIFSGDEKSIVLRSGNTNSGSYTDLKSRYEKIVLESDPREAISTLRKESSKNSGALALCHDILHSIGKTAYTKYGSFKEAVKYQEDFCNSGYIHGLFESYFNSTKDPLANLRDQCDSYAFGRRQFDLWQCHHGVGHGFMYLTGGDLDVSLRLCEDGLGEQQAISSCQNGAYMEVFNLEILAKEKNFVDPENPFLICSARETAKSDCYLYIPAYLSQVLGRDFIDILKECERSETGYEHTCVRGVGSEAMKRNMKDTDNVFAMCAQAGSQVYQEACASGAISMYMNQEGSYSAGKKLCESVPEFYKDVCNKTTDEGESFFR